MNNARNNSGFTMLEIIAVLVLVGITSAVLVSKKLDSGAESVGGGEVIKNHIRYSQILAMKSNTVCGIQFKGAVYSIFRNGSLSDRITLPNSSQVDFPIPPDFAGTNETIYFDLWGIPYTDLTLTTQRPTGLIGNLGITMYTYTGYVK